MSLQIESGNKIDLLIAGVHLKSPGYPNVRYRIQGLKAANWTNTAEINIPMWNGDTYSQPGKKYRTTELLRAIYSHIAVTLKYVFHGSPSLLYIPYPSVFVGFIIGMLPRKLKPGKIVLDVFISLYDTAVNDRKLLTPQNWLAILLKKIEQKAYSSADMIIVDTPQSASFLCREFNLPSTKVHDVPLSTDEQSYVPTNYTPGRECNVLFIGTFIPLHGLTAILEAASILQNEQHIHFQIVGDGQTASEMELAIKNSVIDLDWIREWQSVEKLSELISRADICLGIFGEGDKAQRVCPLKLYAYAACGRAIVTGETSWSLQTKEALSYTPFETTPVNNGAALAKKVMELSNSPERRIKLAKNSRKFYEERLSNRVALEKLKKHFIESNANPIKS